MPTRQPTSLRFNLTVPGLVREEVRDATTFLVVPVVMLQEQVLRCSNCHPDGEFVSAEEIMKSTLAWDNKPVTLSHPSQEFTPENHQRLEVGRIFNAFWDGKLKAEMWLDLKALKSSMKGREVEVRFRKGEVVEVSTGYFTDRIMRKGKFEGVKFGAIQMGIVPDHLAILTDEVGACSVAGGCGAPRLNSNGEKPMDKEAKLLKRFLRFMKLMDDDEGDDGNEGSKSTDGGDAGGVTININTATAGNQDGGNSSASASGDNGGSGEGDLDGGDSGMNEKQKAELVKRLLASKKVETFDEKALLAMTDEQLTSLATLASCGDGDGGDGEKGSAANASKGEGEGEKKNKAPAANADDGEGDGGDGDSSLKVTAEDLKFLTEMRELAGGKVDGIQAMLEASKTEAARRDELKAGLVKSLNKDPQVAMSEAVLNSMSLEALEGLDRTLNPMSYAGMGGARIENTGVDERFAPDPLPVVLADVKKEGDSDDD